MAMKRGGSPVKKRGGGMLIKKRGGGAMGPKKKMAGGGMMGPKKKMAKGGGVRDALKRLKRRTTADMPTGRSAAAKKIANKSKSSKMKGMLMAGKGNPAGKDMSTMALIKRLLAKGPPKRKGPMPTRPPKTMKPLGRRKKG